MENNIIDIPISIFSIKNNFNEGEYLSYKEIISRLNLPSLKANSKTAQLKQIGQFMNLEKINRKYLIKEIYDEPQPIIRKMRKDAVYSKYMNILLLKYLSECHENKASMTQKQWWEQMGMINKQYYLFTLYPAKKKSLLNIETMTEYDIDYFFNKTQKKFSSIFKRTLETLHDRCILDYRIEYIILEDGIQREANEEDRIKIKDAHRKILYELNLELFSQVFYTKNITLKQYYDKVRGIYQTEYGWDKVYEKIEIEYSPTFIQQEIQRDAELLSLNTEAKKELNKFCYDWFISNVYYEYKKQNKIAFDFSHHLKYINPDNQLLLSNKLLLLDT